MCAAAIVAIVMATSTAGAARAQRAQRAQEGRGRITVTVRDSTGVIPGATVAATVAATTPNEPAGPVVTASTDAQGIAVLDGLTAGDLRRTRHVFWVCRCVAKRHQRDGGSAAGARGDAHTAAVFIGSDRHHRESPRAAPARRRRADGVVRRGPDWRHRRAHREGSADRAAGRRHPGESGRRSGDLVDQRDPEQRRAHSDRRPPFSRQGRERRCQPRRPDADGRRSRRSGERRRLRALRLRGGRGRRQFHHARRAQSGRVERARHQRRHL